ncbi:MAG: type 4a pilus biogenesis protein PilO [Candidatus Omnitrophota bacterium]|nr:MAG: type 4a pilus biogenesis protein PilO [Candidatus Omnitrophota bacterium]
MQDLQKIKELFQKVPQFKKFSSFMPLVPFLLMLFYLILLVFPAIRNTFRLLPEASQLKSQITNIEKEWANIDSFNEQIARSDEKLAAYEKSLPGEKEIPAILEYLSDAAKELKVRITEIRPVIEEKDKAATPSIYYKAPILLKAECGYHQLGRFLNKLENADRFMRIDNIKIEADPEKVGIHNVELIVVTYVMTK